MLGGELQHSQQPYVALGILSTVAGIARRNKIRQISSHMRPPSLALRFVVGRPPTGREPTLPKEDGDARDVVLLNMTESPFRCGIKYACKHA